jgi:hypothetical protein
MKSILLTLSIFLPLAISSFPFTLNPPLVKAESATITLNVSQGYVGDYVTVTGSDFTPNKDVTFMWGDQLFSSLGLGFISGMPRYQRPSIAPSTGEVRTDALGNFIVQLQVPKLSSGTYTMKADDTTTTATATFTINAKLVVRNQYACKKHGTSATPSETKSNAYYIELFLAEGFVGDYLAFQLSGFGEGEIVEIKMGTTKLDDFTVGNGIQRGYGFWTSTSGKKVPEIAGGDYTITATGKVSGIAASASFKVKSELFLSQPPPSTPDLSSWPWVYTFGNFSKSWYSSVNATANATFTLEATGLSGTNISSVSVAYSGISPITCSITGRNWVQDGSTQGITSSTLPFTESSPFTDGLSPKAKIPSAIPSGNMLTVTITTNGTGGASYTFARQLFSSSRGANWTDGTLMWLEGDSTTSSDGKSLSGMVNDVNELVATGCNATGRHWPSHIISTGATVSKLDPDCIWGWGLTPYPLATPVSFVDGGVGNGAWDSDEPVYIDNDNSGNVTIGDTRVTQQKMGGKIYRPMLSVAITDPDLGRTLVKFPPETRPSYITLGWWLTVVYLDKYNAGVVSEGDTRLSEAPLPIWWTWLNADANGFIAFSLGVPQYPGAGRAYDVGLFSFDVSVILDSKVTMQILASLKVTSAPVAYQSTYYVTEGSDNIYLDFRGFLGNETLKISVGEKYMKTVTPDVYGYFSTHIDDMPALARGEQTISANGVTTSDNTASTTIVYTPVLSVSPTSGYNLNPVTSIAMTGKGFEAGTYEIILDGPGVGQTVTSCTVADTGDEAGRLNAAFNLPDSVEGNHIVDIVNTSNSSAFYGLSYFDISANNRPNSPFPTNSEFPAVTIYPSLQRTPTTTTVGLMVTITGKGLQPSKTYYLWYNPRGTSTSQARLIADPASVETDASGALIASFHIPESSGGTHYVWVSTSNIVINNDPVYGNPVSTSVYIEPAISLASNSGVVGASVDVAFTGLYASNQYQLWWYKPEEATIDGYSGTPLIPATAALLATVTGDLYGNSTENILFNVPATAEMNTVYAVDLSYFGAYNRYSELANPVFFTVGKVASAIILSLTPTIVTEGESVAINGVIQPAMAIDVTISITAPNGNSTTRTVTSASSGTFTDSFTPNSAGTWQVTAQWNGDATYAAYQSLAATVTVKPIDFSWTYALTGIAIGLVALVVGLLVTVYYFLYKRKSAATPEASAPTATATPK